MRRGIRTEEGRKMAEKKFQLDEIEADLDNDGKLSEYEKTRGEAIQKAMADDEPVNMMCGGLMADDHDMMVGMDPVSGNMVPPGSNEENVRDDIPAALSDGEYVVPADVVRYHGLKTFMGLREEAKLGLMAMAMEGQIQTIEEEDLDEEYEEEETHTMPDGTEMPGATHDEYDEDYSEEEEDYMIELIKKSSRPMIVIGQSVLKLKSGKYIFESLKNYLIKNNKINDEWKAFNILSNNASTVGSYDLDLLSGNGEENPTITNIKENKFEIIFLFGQDELIFKKKNEFVVYIGSHGDKGAELANIILPGASFTEQESHFTNLEGRIQKSYSASYPPGDAKEDWEIINNLSELLKRKKLFNDKNELVDSMLNYLKLNKKEENTIDINFKFISEKIDINPIDYYFSNVIARASKTMAECRSEKTKIERTGTEG